MGHPGNPRSDTYSPLGRDHYSKPGGSACKISRGGGGGLTRGQGGGGPCRNRTRRRHSRWWSGAGDGLAGCEGGWGGGRIIPGLRFWRGLNVYCFGMFGNVGHVRFGHTVTTPPGSLRRAILVQVEPHGEGGVCTVREKKNHLIKNIRPGRSRMQRGDIGNHSRWKFQ